MRANPSTTRPRLIPLKLSGRHLVVGSVPRGKRRQPEPQLVIYTMLLLSGLHHQNVYSSPLAGQPLCTVHCTLVLFAASEPVNKALIGLMGKFSFWFLNCYIGQPSQPVSVKLPSSSCLEPWPHPGKGTLPMPDQAGKLSSERN